MAQDMPKVTKKITEEIQEVSELNVLEESEGIESLPTIKHSAVCFIDVSLSTDNFVNHNLA